MEEETSEHRIHGEVMDRGENHNSDLEIEPDASTLALVGEVENQGSLAVDFGSAAPPKDPHETLRRNRELQASLQKQLELIKDALTRNMELQVMFALSHHFVPETFVRRRLLLKLLQRSRKHSVEYPVVLTQTRYE